MLPRLMGAVVGLAVAGMVTNGMASSLGGDTITLGQTGGNFPSEVSVLVGNGVDYSISENFEFDWNFGAIGNEFYWFGNHPGFLGNFSPSFNFLDLDFSDGNRIIDFEIYSTVLSDLSFAIITDGIIFSHTSLSIPGIPEHRVEGVILHGRFITTPLPPPVPLPAAFPLFATALAGMGLLGWRRKRKAAA